MEDRGQPKGYKKSYIVALVLVVLLLFYGKEFFPLFLRLYEIIRPFIVGCAFAFVLNLPMRFIEKKILFRLNGKKYLSPLSIFLSILFILLLVLVLLFTVIPEITQGAVSIAKEVPPFLNKCEEWISEELSPIINDTPWLLEKLSTNWDSIMEEITSFLKNGFFSLFSSTLSAAGSLISGITSFFISLIFAIYLLGEKEKLQRQIRRIMKAYLKSEVRERIEHIAFVLNKNFSSFISGQCLEAVILGSIFIVVLSILRMPYAVMIGILTMFCALLPIVGAFISCILGAFLILLESPIKALWFIVIFLVVQQLENNIIYPRVVGSSVGLPSLWVFVAISIGGSLFGVLGMVVFIPLVSTLYTLIKEGTDRRLSSL